MACPVCGKELPATARFCDGCGTFLTANAPASSGASTVVVAPVAKSSAAAGQGAGADIRARSLDAWKALKVFGVSPVEGLPRSFAMFDENRALQVGLVFGAAHAVTVLLSIGLFGARLSSYGFGFSLSDLSIATLLKILITALVPFAALAGAGALVRVLFRGTGRPAGDVYVAGAALLPLDVALLLGAMLGAANLEIGAVVGLSALCYTILILYSGCAQIASVAPTSAAPAVPIMLLASGYLTKVIVAAFL
jgi:hypothetical protein